jgi:hypothetical protein
VRPQGTESLPPPTQLAGEREGSPHRNSGDIFVKPVALAAIAYLLLFNTLAGETLRLSIAAAVVAAAAVTGALISLGSPQLRLRVTLLLLLLLPAIWIGLDIAGRGAPSYASAARLFFPLVAALGWTSISIQRPVRIPLLLSAAVAMLGVGSAVLAGPIEVGGLVRLAPFTGGEDGAHASAYLIALALIAVVSVWPVSERKHQRQVLVVLLTLLLVWAQVATALMLVAVFLLGRWLMSSALSWIRKTGLALLSLIGGVAIVLGHEVITSPSGEIGLLGPELGSGRMAAWSHRIALLSERDTGDLLLGTGPGSDSFVTDIWWWEAKDAHSDVLTILIESGITGLVIVSVVLFVIARQCSGAYVPFVTALCFTSLISNALLSRPVHALLYWFIAVAATSMKEASGSLHVESTGPECRSPAIGEVSSEKSRFREVQD